MEIVKTRNTKGNWNFLHSQGTTTVGRDGVELWISSSIKCSAPKWSTYYPPFHCLYTYWRENPTLWQSATMPRSFFKHWNETFFWLAIIFLINKLFELELVEVAQTLRFHFFMGWIHYASVLLTLFHHIDVCFLFSNRHHSLMDLIKSLDRLYIIFLFSSKIHRLTV